MSDSVLHCEECGLYKAIDEDCPADRALCPYLASPLDGLESWQGPSYSDIDAVMQSSPRLEHEAFDDERSIAVRAYESSHPNPNPLSYDDDPATEIYNDSGTHDPVVGWLVCIEGPNKGQDYRLRMQNNTIGRANAHIIIDADKHISRGNHAMISYDPEENSFTIVPGSERGITRLNNKALYEAKTLLSHDKVRLGKSVLLFVSLCGDNFNWQHIESDITQDKAKP